MEQTAFWISRKRKGWIALGIGLCFGLIAGGCSFLIQTTPVTVQQQIESGCLFKQPSTKTNT